MFDHFGGQISYTPTWTATVSNPSIGNGSILGGYFLLGRLCVYTFRVSPGSTTTFGSGTWLFSLPFPCKTGLTWNGSALCQDNSAAIDYTGTSHINMEAGSSITSAVIRIHGASANAVSSTVPFTWANLDQLVATLVYPIQV